MNLTAETEGWLLGLPRKRRQVVLAGLDEFARGLRDQTRTTDDLKKVEAASRAATDVLKLLMTATSGRFLRLAELLAELRAATDAEEMTGEELEASGRLQVLALYRTVEEESLTVAELEAAGISRQRLKQLRDQNRLLGVKLPFQRGFLYPRWQFARDLRPRGFLPRVLAAAAEEGLDALTVHRVMTNPAAGGGASPLELCETGQIEQALNALRTVGELGG